MFALIESGRAQRGSQWTSRTLSLAIHAAIITAAVMATKQVVHDPGPEIFVVRHLQWPAAPASAAPASPCVGCSLPGRPFPPDIPVTLPPPTLTEPPAVSTTFVPGVPFDTGSPGPNLLPTGARSPAGLPLESRVVDEPPEMISHPEPRYPEILRQAGIEGSVVVEAVLDTTGRAEAGSLKIVGEAHPLFAAEAERVVLASRYRAGRMAGRAVRVRVRVPISFGIQR